MNIFILIWSQDLRVCWLPFIFYSDSDELACLMLMRNWPLPHWIKVSACDKSSLICWKPIPLFSFFLNREGGIFLWIDPIETDWEVQVCSSHETTIPEPLSCLHVNHNECMTLENWGYLIMRYRFMYRCTFTIWIQKLNSKK